MDALGVLAIFDQSRLGKLQYAMTVDGMVNIPKSPFIIVFPQNGMQYQYPGNYATVPCTAQPLLCVAGAGVTYARSTTNYTISLSLDGQTVTANVAFGFAYPIS